MEGEFYRLARVPLFEEVTLDQIAWERLGGLTNKNYKITLEEHSYVLRVTGEGTSEYIDRAVDPPIFVRHLIVHCVPPFAERNESYRSDQRESSASMLLSVG